MCNSEGMKQLGDTGRNQPISDEQRQNMLATFQLMAKKQGTTITFTVDGEEMVFTSEEPVVTSEDLK